MASRLTVDCSTGTVAEVPVTQAELDQQAADVAAAQAARQAAQTATANAAAAIAAVKQAAAGPGSPAQQLAAALVTAMGW